MGAISLVFGSRENASEDVQILARQVTENPRVVAATGPAIKDLVVEKASSLFLDESLVLVLHDPQAGLLDELAPQLRMLTERLRVIIYCSEPREDLADLLGLKPFVPEQDKEKRVRQRVLAILRPLGKKMTDKAYTLLKDRVREEAVLELELAKLVAYVGEKPTIELKDVTVVVTETHEETFFSLFDALGKKDKKTAIAILEDLMSQGVHLLAIHGYLVRQLRLLLQAHDAGKQIGTRIDYKQFSKAFPTLKEGLPSDIERKHYLAYQKPYFAFNLLKTGGRFSRKELVALFDALVRFDETVKTGTRFERVHIESALLGE